jgi:sulfoxide reductase heme-binding subunit YedZ
MRERKGQWLQIATHIGALMPLALLVWAFWRGRLGPVPIAAVIRRTGRYALILLILSLVPTVAVMITGYRRLAYVRRWLGLYAFAYSALHFLAFAGLDYGFRLGLIARAIVEGRREIVGLVALTILGLLALTSIRAVMIRLGRTWRRLHRLVYLAGALVALHYVWNYKELRVCPALAGVGLLILLAARLPPIADRLRRLRRQREPTSF